MAKQIRKDVETELLNRDKSMNTQAVGQEHERLATSRTKNVVWDEHVPALLKRYGTVFFCQMHESSD